MAVLVPTPSKRVVQETDHWSVEILMKRERTSVRPETLTPLRRAHDLPILSLGRYWQQRHPFLEDFPRGGVFSFHSNHVLQQEGPKWVRQLSVFPSCPTPIWHPGSASLSSLQRIVIRTCEAGTIASGCNWGTTGLAPCKWCHKLKWRCGPTALTMGSW